MRYAGTSLHWVEPLTARPNVTAGLMCPPLAKAIHTPANTPRPHPKLMSSQPPLKPLVLASSTVATTPQPRRTSIPVPSASRRRILPKSRSMDDLLSSITATTADGVGMPDSGASSLTDTSELTDRDP